jgi:environmental stress-induced protein Ves
MILIRPAEYRRMPWKNGGGVTTEIAVSPPGAGVSDFDWRISMATVAQAGPFSVFPEIDRTLAILEGPGIDLDIEGVAVTLTPSSPPHSFPADAPTHGVPIAGPIVDLNVMTRRGRFRHAVRRLTGAGRLTIDLRGSPSLLLAMAACAVDGVAIPAGSAVLLSSPSTLALVADQAIDCYAIDLFRV